MLPNLVRQKIFLNGNKNFQSKQISFLKVTGNKQTLDVSLYFALAPVKSSNIEKHK